MPDLVPLRAAAAELQAHAEGRLPPDHFVVGRRGGITLTRADGTVLALPHPSYTAAFDRLWDAFRAAGYDPDARLNHVDRMAGRRVDAGLLTSMSAEDLHLFLVWARCGERFCDGLWAGLVEQGELLAAARRIMALAGEPLPE